MRSAYLYYFSHFITWPDNTQFPNGELKLCVRTDNEKDRFQLTTINNKSLGANKLTIVLVDNEDDNNGTYPDLPQCHMLYVASNHMQWLEGLRADLGIATLLVTEGEQDERGVIHLFMKNNKLKFSIDNSLLKDRDFKASSKLLPLSATREGP